MPTPTIDSTGEGYTSSGTSMSWNHTINGSEFEILIVGVTIDNATVPFTAVTFNSVPMTLAILDGAVQDTALYYMLASQLPAAGTYAVQATTGTSVPMGGISVNILGANQGAPEDTDSDSGTSISSVSGTLVPVSGETLAIILAATGANLATALAEGGSQSVIIERDRTEFTIGMSSLGIDPAASTGVSYSSGGSVNRFVLCAMTVAPPLSDDIIIW